MKTSNSVLSAVVVSVLGLSTMVGALQALAVDTKNYPGWLCKSYAGSTPTESYGSIYNGSPRAFTYINCPVIKGVLNSPIYSGWVRVTDRHPNAGYDIVCNLVATYRTSNNSNLYYSYNKRESAHSHNNVQHLPFGRPTFDAIPLGHYHYTCHIPPAYNGNASEIHTYSVTEEGDG